MAGRISIMTYMNKNINDHIDPLTGEVNATALAEDAAWHFDEELVDKYFDYAFIVAERYEIKTGVSSGSLARLSGFINSLPSDCI